MSDQKPAKISRISLQDNPNPGGDLGNDSALEVTADERNPMLNNVVLTRFLEISELSDLKIFRLVSQEWNKLSLDRFRNEMPVALEPNVFIEMNNVAQLYSEKILEKPFKSYILRGFVIGNEADPGWWSTFDPPMPTFWERCGPSIRRLELDNCAIQEAEALKRILSMLPNLEILIVRISVLSFVPPIEFMEERYLGFGADWQSPPNLKSIKLHIDIGLPMLSLILSQYSGSVGARPGWTLSWDFGTELVVSLERD